MGGRRREGGTQSEVMTETDCAREKISTRPVKTTSSPVTEGDVSVSRQTNWGWSVRSIATVGNCTRKQVVQSNCVKNYKRKRKWAKTAPEPI